MMAAFDEVKFKKLEEAHAKHLIVGIADAAGVAPRQDIDVFLDKNPQTFNLLLIALYELQNDKNTKDPMGYFQIAGNQGCYRQCLNRSVNAVKVSMELLKLAGMASV